jgi:peroxiredoxin
VPLLSDWNAEATLAFDVAFDLFGMKDLAVRSAFLIEGDTVRASWMLAREMPDIDAVIATASSLSR